MVMVLVGIVGVVTKGKRMDAAGKPTQVRLRWPDGSHSRWLLIQDVMPPPRKPLSTIAQAMVASEEAKRVAREQAPTPSSECAIQIVRRAGII
jgi:hypothetical protein